MTQLTRGPPSNWSYGQRSPDRDRPTVWGPRVTGARGCGRCIGRPWSGLPHRANSWRANHTSSSAATTSDSRRRRPMYVTVSDRHVRGGQTYVLRKVSTRPGRSRGQHQRRARGRVSTRHTDGRSKASSSARLLPVSVPSCRDGASRIEPPRSGDGTGSFRRSLHACLRTRRGCPAGPPSSEARLKGDVPPTGEGA